MSASIEPGLRTPYYIVKHYLRADDKHPSAYRATDNYAIAIESMNYLLAQGNVAWVEHIKDIKGYERLGD